MIAPDRGQPMPSVGSWPMRRAPFVGRAPVGTWRNELCADCPPVDYPTDKTRCAPCPRRPLSLAVARALDVLEERAATAARLTIKEIARAYALKPRHLDAIAEGLFDCSPDDLVICLDRLIVIMRETNQRMWFGFGGGEIPALNLRGAMLYARWSRRVAGRIAER